MNTLPIPTVDVSGEPARQVIISPGTPDEYQGHPTTLLMPDHETMFCVYPLGHGGPGVVLRRSSDAGLTWSAPLPVPDNWATANNCPAIFRFVGPDSIERLFVYEGNGDMRQAMSLDQGQSWTPLEPNGLKTIMRYFEIEPGGQSSFDRHEHDHGVYILKGRAKVLIGWDVHDVGPGDVVYIAPNEQHQFESVGEGPLGFLCVVPPKDNPGEQC
jgi:quercetin dioxygenase-like cupin family protein